MNEQGTPRTDTFCSTPYHGWFPDEFTCSVLNEWAEFARQLERELAAAQAEIARLKEGK